MEKLKFLLILIIFPFMFIGCSQEESFSSNISEVETSNELQESSSFFEEDVPIDREVSNITVDIGSDNKVVLHNDFIYTAKTDWLVDLDGDGVAETIYYETELIEEERNVHLWINGVDFGKYVDIYEPLESHFFIVDINKNDDFFEIVVSTYGMSDDLESQWFRYSNGIFYDLGYTEMMPNNFMYFKDDGSLIIYSRTDIFGTNFIPMKYILENNKLKIIEENFYNFGLVTQTPYICEVNLNVHTDLTVDSQIITLKKGTEFFSTKTDGKEWVNILLNNNEYWLHIKDFCLLDNENLFVTDVVKNLILAD